MKIRVKAPKYDLRKESYTSKDMAKMFKQKKEVEYFIMETYWGLVGAYIGLQTIATRKKKNCKVKILLANYV